ncbi:MAG TPA: hypothetical protein VMT27_00660, partial [Actinomycetes bacterium]|nr:hypothetical protein [Actinomycetes bacterium]
DAGANEQATQIAVDENASARINGLDAALAVLALLALLSLFFTGRVPDQQPGSQDQPDTSDADPEEPRRVTT